MAQSAVGFPITGHLLRNKACPIKEPKEPHLPRRTIFGMGAALFRERLPKSGRMNAADLWKEAMD